MKIINQSQVNILYDLLEARKSSSSREIFGSVRNIIDRVAAQGDSAVREFSAEFDKFCPEKLVLSREEINALAAKVPPELLETIKKAAANIREYHEKQQSCGYEINKDGKTVGRIVRPLDIVGVYVPAGSAALPSSVLMNCIPASVAGVREIILCTPPKKDGINPAIAAAAVIAGVSRIFTIGGAQAVAAMAYGTETVPRVDKITGPGNIYVAEAKKQLFGTVDIDMIAGPSDILIIADENAKADYIAADMLSQLEHDIKASAILLTDSRALIDEVKAQLEIQLSQLTNPEIARSSYNNFCAAVCCEDIASLFEISNTVAPEHLEIMLPEPEKYLDLVKNAGSVFLGEYTPEVLGDYFAGTNHILPTHGTARFSSPLSVEDFVKKMSYLKYSKQAFDDACGDTVRFAQCEELEAHAGSMLIRQRNEC